MPRRRGLGGCVMPQRAGLGSLVLVDQGAPHPGPLPQGEGGQLSDLRSISGFHRCGCQFLVRACVSVGRATLARRYAACLQLLDVPADLSLGGLPQVPVPAVRRV